MSYLPIPEQPIASMMSYLPPLPE